jgi:hypothetical protein
MPQPREGGNESKYQKMPLLKYICDSRFAFFTAIHSVDLKEHIKFLNNYKIGFFGFFTRELEEL